MGTMHASDAHIYTEAITHTHNMKIYITKVFVVQGYFEKQMSLHM